MHKYNAFISLPAGSYKFAMVYGLAKVQVRCLKVPLGNAKAAKKKSMD